MLGFPCSDPGSCLLYGLATAVAALALYGLHPLKRWRYRRFPGPPFRWLVGHLPEIRRHGLEGAHARWAAQFPSPFVYWLGAQPVVMTAVPDQARKVLARPSRPPFPSLHTGLEAQAESYSLVYANGEKWRAARNAWAPFFTKDTLAKLGPAMSGSAARLAAQLGAAAGAGRGVDVFAELGKMTLEVVGGTAFGVAFDALGSPDGESGPGPVGGQGRVSTPAARILSAIRTYLACFSLGNPMAMLPLVFPELARPIRWLAKVFPPATLKKDIAARSELRAVGVELVRQYVAQHEEAGRQGGGADAGASTSTPPTARKRPDAIDPGSFLALIIPSMGQMAGHEVLGELWAAMQARVFISAGYETTGTALAYAVYLLASNPEAEAKLLAEVDAASSQEDGTLPGAGPDGIAAALPYTTACIQEALRIFPPVCMVPREPREGMALGGLAVPPDAHLQVSIIAMHRSEHLWRDPLAYKPERFLAGTPEAAEAVPGAFLPFGDGPRKCVGYRFALMEATTALYTLYRQFTFRLLPGQVPLKLRTTITTCPANGVHVTVHRRE